MAVDKLGTKLDISDSMAIKEKVELVLSEKGMTTMDLIRGIPMSKGGFYTKAPGRAWIWPLRKPAGQTVG